MKNVFVSAVLIVLFNSPASAFDLSCSQGQITIKSHKGVNYLNGSPMVTRGNFLFGAPGKFKVWAGLDRHVEATLWIYEDRDSDFVRQIVDCELAK